MKLYVGVTDTDWYNYLLQINPEDINFWVPGGNTTFRVLESGAPFLFKLKYPVNKVAGVGFFSSFTKLPLNIAWDVFGERNGCSSFSVLQNLIGKYRAVNTEINPEIGCIVLTNPVFFKKEDWITVPDNWKKNIVKGKSYQVEYGEGKELWTQVEMILEKYMKDYDVPSGQSEMVFEEQPMYGKSVLTKVRIGQGAFRVLVTDAYSRRCSITGERTLPVLEAAHIKSFASAGPNSIANGLLLRSDLHKLYDAGYLTITNELKTEVSKRIKEEFENGREYYKLHGSGLLYLPKNLNDRPKPEYIQWHNENVYKG